MSDSPIAALFSPWDFGVAHENFGAMCGHGALAAALGTDVTRVMQHFKQGGWVNVPIMGTALKNAGRLPTRVEGWPPEAHKGPAVTLLQWTGRWMNEGVPAAARCEHRHWVAVRHLPGLGLHVWDINEPQWIPLTLWVLDVLPRLLPPNGDGGWHPYRSFIWLERPVQPPAIPLDMLTLSAWQRRAMDMCRKGMALAAGPKDITTKQRQELDALVKAQLLTYHPGDRCYRRS